MQSAIEGFPGPSHPLSPHAAIGGLSQLGRGLLRYSPTSLWERETSRLPPDLRKLRHRVRAFAVQHLDPLALAMDRAEHRPPGVWDPEVRKLVEKAGRAGYLTDLVPKPIGDLSPTLIGKMVWAQAIKTEEMARICGGLMLLLSAHHLGVAPFILSGDLAAARRFVLPAYRRLRRGDPDLFAFAITEPGAGSDVEEGHGAGLCHPGTVARRAPDRDGWLLNGRKCFISGGDLARTIAVFASLESEGMESWTCFAVTSEMPGFRVVRNELKMGMRASAATELEFDNVFVPDSHVVGGLRKGWGINRGTLNFSRLPVAAMAVGFAQSAVDLTRAFITSRRLGGRRLIDYQEIQLQFAQMLAETSAIRALVWQKAKFFTPRQADASMCKFHCTDRALEVVNIAMDLFGNHCLEQGNRIEKVFRDLRLTQIFEGTNEINRLAVIEDCQEELVPPIASMDLPSSSID